MTDAELLAKVARIRVDIYEGRKLVCRSSTLGDCYPDEPTTQMFAARLILAGRPYITHACTLEAATD